MIRLGCRASPKALACRWLRLSPGGSPDFPRVFAIFVPLMEPEELNLSEEVYGSRLVFQK